MEHRSPLILQRDIYWHSYILEFTELLENWSANRPDLSILSIIQCGKHCNRRCIVIKFHTLTRWNACWSTVGLV